MGPTILDGLLGYQRQQEALVMDKQKVQENSLAINARMVDLQQQQAENEAIKKFDPNNLDSLQQVAGTLAQGGDAKGAMKILDAYQGLRDKQALVQTRLVDQKAKQFQLAGGVLTGMAVDEKSYHAGLMTLMSNGISPIQFGLTGNYEDDRAHIPAAAKSTVSAYEQMQLQARAKTEDRQIRQEDQRIKQDQFRNDKEDQRIKLEERRVEATETARVETAKRDVMAQNKADNALHVKQQAMATVKPDDLATALSTLADDPRTEDATDAQKAVLARRVANRAKQAIASRLNTADADTDFTPGNYEEEVRKQFDIMVKKKEWGMKKGQRLWGLMEAPGNLHPELDAAPKTPHIAQVKSDADYDKLPSGTEYVGPDGKKRRKP